MKKILFAFSLLVFASYICYLLHNSVTIHGNRIMISMIKESHCTICTCTCNLNFLTVKIVTLTVYNVHVFDLNCDE